MSILRKLGIQLINIHGQHDSASLFDEDNHLAFLDAFAGNEALRSDYGEKYETVAKLRREIDRLTMDEGEKLRRMETLKYQIAEIEKAELEPGEDERLEDRRNILAGRAVFPAQLVNDVQPGLDLFQLVGGIA